MRPKKRYQIDVEFPELLVKNKDQKARTEGTNLRMAINEALKDILKRDGVKRHKITTGTIKFHFLPQISEAQAVGSDKPKEQED